MNKKADLFYKIGEPYAAGLFEEPDRERFFRYSRAIRRYYEHCTLPDAGTGKLYPSGPKYNDDYAVLPEFSYTVSVDKEALGAAGSNLRAYGSDKAGKSGSKRESGRLEP